MPSMLSKQIIRITNGIVSEYNVQKNLTSALQGRKLDPIKKYCVCLILQTQAAPGTVQAHKIEQISKHLQSYSSIIGNFAATVFFKDLERSSMVKGALRVNRNKLWTAHLHFLSSAWLNSSVSETYPVRRRRMAHSQHFGIRETAEHISLLLRAESENRMWGIQKEVTECMADVVTFGLAIFHVAVTRLLILAREVNRDGHSYMRVFFQMRVEQML